MKEISDTWTINEGVPDEEGEGDDGGDITNLMNMDNKDGDDSGSDKDIDVDDL